MTKQVQQSITPTHVIGSTGTADTSDLGYRALGSFKSDLGLGTSLTQTANNGNGTAGTPAFAFVGDENTGIFRPAADELGFVTNGSEKVRIDSAGNVGIGTSAPGAKLDVAGGNVGVSTIAGRTYSTGLVSSTNPNIVNGSGFNSIPIRVGDIITFFDNQVRTVTSVTDTQLTVNANWTTSFAGATATGVGGVGINTNNTERMRIDSAGNVGIGTGSPATRLHVDGTIRYTNRPAAGTITAIGFDTNGDLKASSSSLRYKHDIQDYSKGLAEVMQLRPVSFKFNGEENTNIGFIAEEVDALGLTEVMLYNEEEQPEGVIYANMVSLLTKAIQEQQSIINELKVRIETLESNV
jgi:hypothetical protein